MQQNNNNNIALDETSFQEYKIDKVIYNVNRLFSKKTIKDILLEKISSEIATITN